MDYEKKYDELMAKIEAVKKDPKIGLKDGDYYNGYVQKGIRSALDYLLQEESEDERIRKILIHIVKGAFDKYGIKYRGDEISEEKILAYLEKQKEQKPNIELIQKSWYLEGYHDGKYNNEPKWLIQTGKGGPRYEENQKYGTQKPAEWSEEDEKMLLSAIEYVQSYPAHRQSVVNWLQCKLKSLRPQPHWKPSKEQMDALMWQVKNTSEGSWQRRASEELYNDLQKLL